jgi:hypothetical protein
MAHLVVRREVVAPNAEWTDPDLGVVVHTGIRAEDGIALLAGNRLIGQYLAEE